MMIMIVGVKRTFQECFTYLSTDYLLFMYSDNDQIYGGENDRAMQATAVEGN